MSQSLDGLRRVFDEAISQKISPAIAASFGTLESSHSLYCGALDLKQKSLCAPGTVFDLASLTKILSTTFIAAEAISQKRLSLFETPFCQWPNVRVLDLMQHTSGLPAWINFSLIARSQNEVLEKIFDIPTNPIANTRSIYSDLGFIALGHLLEIRLKEKIDILFRHLSKRYVPESDLSYLPTSLCPPQDTSRFAPTGHCDFRRRELRGEVNDLNAFVMGGVAGHAGLFGTLDDVAAFARFFLLAIKKRRGTTQNNLSLFASWEGDRALGFDRPTKTGSTAGVLSPLAIGHLGFTGTSLWIDPAAANGQGAFFILLTNHLQTCSSKKDLLALRQTFHRQAYKLLTNPT